MNFDTFFKDLQDIAHQDWFFRIVILLVILLITWLVGRAFGSILRRILERGRGPLPKNSIFINLIKFFVWVIGISIILGVCFNIDLSAILTALGVGGIAVSLGFQATLSNLIGGLEVSISKIFVPGDNVQSGNMNLRGIVKDVTWRHTTITDYSGNEIVVPNSVMNTQSLVRLLPRGHISIPLSIMRPAPDLAQVATNIETAAKAAVESITTLESDPELTYSEVGDGGIKATLSLVVTDNDKVTAVTDACIRAAAPYTHSASA